MSEKVLVIGSGIIGLRTALELIRRKIHVCLFSPQPPLHPLTCSMGAGGLWMPFHCDDNRTDRWAVETLDELTDLAGCSSSTDSAPNVEKAQNPKSLVEILPVISFKRSAHSIIPGWAIKCKSVNFRQLEINTLYEDSKSQGYHLPRRELIEHSGYSHAWLFQAPVIDAPKMLTHMLNEIESSPYADVINVRTGKYYSTISEMAEEARNLQCDALVNCTGMGSKQLCSDDSLIGARGALLFYDRIDCKWHRPECTSRTKHNTSSQPNKNNGGFESSCEIKDSVIMVESEPLGSDTEPCYMIPRGNVIAVGGTYLEGDTERTIRPLEKQKILENAKTMGIDTSLSFPIGEWVGLRPYRPSVRLELDESASSLSNIRVVHNYGHGGSGWTVCSGAAKEAVSLLVSQEY